jgi:hypothetical protein
MNHLVRKLSLIPIGAHFKGVFAKNSSKLSKLIFSFSKTACISSELIVLTKAL